MKTIAFDNSPRTWIRTALAAGALYGLYTYYRRGGTSQDLINKGKDYVNSARSYLKSTGIDASSSNQSFNASSSGTDQSWNSGQSRAQEIPTTSEDLDRIPST